MQEKLQHARFDPANCQGYLSGRRLVIKRLQASRPPDLRQSGERRPVSRAVQWRQHRCKSKICCVVVVQ
jgi:hypothetical protein